MTTLANALYNYGTCISDFSRFPPTLSSEQRKQREEHEEVYKKVCQDLAEALIEELKMTRMIRSQRVDAAIRIFGLRHKSVDDLDEMIHRHKQMAVIPEDSQIIIEACERVKGEKRLKP